MSLLPRNGPGPAGGTGLVLAGLILASWIGSLVLLLPADLGRLPLPLLLLAVLVRTLLQTGLFIVGHDAMHGVLLPAHRRTNHRLGALALAFYACLPYGRCCASHLQHHQAPGSATDPDHRSRPDHGFLAWYAHFMAGYLSPGPLLGLLAGWGLLTLAAAGLLASGSVLPALAPPELVFPGGVCSAAVNVLLFCTLPLLLSSLQLFVFGTYLPHRGPSAGLNSHHARSLELPEWISLLACFHFGYHWEHHEFPGAAWFELPGKRACRRHGRHPLRWLAAPSASR